MSTQALAEQPQDWTEEKIIEGILGGNGSLYELLIRRYNRRLYRVIRAILRDDAETEDVMQEAYVRAYQHLRDFAGRSSFSTWLIRIGVHEALARVKKSQRTVTSDFESEEAEMAELLAVTDNSPERQTATEETRVTLERAILALPALYRTVLVMRDVEEMSTSDTATALNLTAETVKVRLHRARAMLRRELYARVGATSSAAFEFQAPRCNRVTDAVMSRLGLRTLPQC